MAGTDRSRGADWSPMGPVFVLVRPQLGENIGAAARAMWNFGLRGLRLVAPRDGWPNPSAVAMASGAGGLLDEARAWVATSYPAGEPSGALARAVAFRRGGATRAAIGTAESLARALPEDYQPALLPPLLRELLYPRRYLPSIAGEAARHGADPRLLLAIMREESRFDPRAKSAAAARGLLPQAGRAVGA